jgi:hypothetical protein
MWKDGEEQVDLRKYELTERQPMREMDVEDIMTTEENGRRHAAPTPNELMTPRVGRKKN